MIRVKICGITDLETALLAAEAGADALGFVFAGSPRYIAPETARRISRALPPFVTRVGVFVDAPLETIREMVHFCSLDAVQLHGQEPPEYCRLLPCRVIKAFRIEDGGGLPDFAGYPADAFLVDTAVPGKAGGTGRTFNWQLVAGLNLPRPLILAGGLNPENVGRAVSTVRPYGVDVSSGVERDGRPGIKDPDKIRRFIAAARGCKPAASD
ncbi:phosphoribosylanthranilate isomerase [Desulfofundulus thermobenzoicus]|uniref:N-(5'-phosphoribosyl)anthranilate isomerase n=1 Tax=Desulfofundulus thermobenzoicus TaxID=29376 RepID=A0A6N7INU2_9FIRM|nr:phosphoribosylanthranilate isomerase [Desulfofundulus thermobenzoicus]MQL51600.1 phosphoribosylanthranilate isomerase [Desulfofundulus thermobenzoicus]HHW42965.1 phosphoribosylanthranilate isomerase [Desulfotomaculum sp.]